MSTSEDIKNKTFLITGASSGIGKAMAMQIADAGGHVVLVCRNQGRAAEARSEIIGAINTAVVDILVYDLSSQKSIRELSAEIHKRYQKIDVLINNAGGIWGERILTEDNIEMTLAVNHLAYFMLSLLILDLLPPGGRIINVASRAHSSAKMNFANLQGEKKYSGVAAYGESKMANILFTYELAERLKDRKIDVNCFHPGMVNSNWGATAHPAFKLLLLLVRPLMISASKGAETGTFLAISENISPRTGGYFAKEKPIKSSKLSYDREVAKKLWKLSEELTGVSHK